jgi:pimeloyl-ACP methyl ester carboxylesterase
VTTSVPRADRVPEPGPPDDDLPDADNAQPPATRLRVSEWPRASREISAALLSGALIDRWPHGDGHPVLVVPGFLSGESSTRFLRRALQRLGYTAYDWELGRNYGVRRGMEEAFDETLRRLAAEHGRRVSIIGWSAGGIYAREIGRRNPDDTRMVVTLGSPFRGNHRATHAWRLYSLLNRGPDLEESMSEARRRAREAPLSVPTTCLYSRVDGIVAWECCTSLPGPTTENVEVTSSHLGFGHNLEALYVIADRLAQPEGAWRPLEEGPARKRQVLYLPRDDV